MKRITFTVTNDLTYDQRMHRICRTLSQHYEVVLLGRRLKTSVPLSKEMYRQTRLNCFFGRGKLMYVEFNLRLLLVLLFTNADCYVAIDLDTIVPNLIASVLKNKKRVYDAHELFTEQKEIVTRPLIHRIWLQVEKFAVPRFKNGYTVNDFIAAELYRRYGVRYSTIRNLPLPYDAQKPTNQKKIILYQGAVNEGRSFETLIAAMKYVDAPLIIIGQGNFFDRLQQLIAENGVADKVELKGLVEPNELKKITPTAYIAVTLFEETGLNQYQSLANRFFDYIMAGVPQVCVNYPQYKTLNDKYTVAHLVSDTKAETIATALNNLLHDTVYHSRLMQNCLIARRELNWHHEQNKLLTFYKTLLE